MELMSCDITSEAGRGVERWQTGRIEGFGTVAADRAVEGCTVDERAVERWQTGS